MQPPPGTICLAARSYADVYTAWARCSVSQAVDVVVAEFPMDDGDFADLISSATPEGEDMPGPTLAEVVAGARVKARELKEQGDTKGAKNFTSFAGALDKYTVLVITQGHTSEHAEALNEHAGRDQGRAVAVSLTAIRASVERVRAPKRYEPHLLRVLRAEGPAVPRMLSLRYSENCATRTSSRSAPHRGRLTVAV